MKASDLIFTASFLFAAVSTAAPTEPLQILQQRNIESLDALGTAVSEKSAHEKRARITIEDCLKGVPNKYALVMIAAARARKLVASATEQAKFEKEKHIQITQQDLQDLRSEIKKCQA
ncbi:hypothetical protein B0O99DRAFT_600723 [Bisporella sp. PMI_857]|nr:hypothetical protein B0O99DRAFT_600723 [Bisporella sp. PMI_857]